MWAYTELQAQQLSCLEGRSSDGAYWLLARVTLRSSTISSVVDGEEEGEGLAGQQKRVRLYRSQWRRVAARMVKSRKDGKMERWKVAVACAVSKADIGSGKQRPPRLLVQFIGLAPALAAPS